MNKIQLAVMATLFSVILPTTAATQVTQPDASAQQIAVISATGSSPNEVIKKLNQKADQIGASQFKVVTLTSQDNNERATAIAYR